MPALRHRKLAIALVLLSAFVVWLAALQMYRFSRFGALGPMAYRLQQGIPTEPADIRAMVPLATAVADENLCQSDFLRSGYVILLAALDLENQDSGYDAWASALGRAEAFGRHALGCSPTNGNFWLRMAMLRQAEGEEPREIFRLVDNSQLYAPAEERVIAGRYALYGRLSGASITLLAPVIDRDLGIICSDSGNGIRDTLAPPSKAIGDRLKAISPRCVIPSKTTG